MTGRQTSKQSPRDRDTEKCIYVEQSRQTQKRLIIKENPNRNEKKGVKERNRDRQRNVIIKDNPNRDGKKGENNREIEKDTKKDLNKMDSEQSHKESCE